ncbi:glycosyl transferase family 1 [Roseivivax halodurans JCM 10272]|uniref:Glycosyl transferase family 1 n=1 Tax=Roseivivax halodurans JCM 10272 TaxID=1449350 RepID=X7EJ29_9RHOB|nr:glycosyl transferase family 1 [Roseivivax halodurans JCM 10272]
MRIAVVAHPRHPIAEPFMGGLEAHTAHLCRALARRGHDVTLYASGDSDAGVRLRPILPEHYERQYPWHAFRESETLTGLLDDAYGEILDELGGFDVVHNNSLHRYVPRYARRDRVPMVTSLHVPPFDVLERTVASSGAPWSRFTCCSEAHAASWWSGARPSHAHVVHNGIDPSLWEFKESGDGSAVWIGRMSRTKAPHLAIAAARRAGIPLRLFGTMDDYAYFRDEVRPLLGDGVTHEGHLTGKALAEEVRHSSVLLFTPTWDEPFGLVAAEAMACGLPVAAFDIGAAREVIGEAGALAPVGDVSALARAICDAVEIPRSVPRARVERLFTQDRMVAGYEALYREVMRSVSRPAPTVHFRPIELPPQEDVKIAV